MTKTVEAIYEDGVLKPVEPLQLDEHERVTVVVPVKQNAVAVTQSHSGEVQPGQVTSEAERQALLDALFADMDRAKLHLGWRIPAREELYDRF